MDPPAYPDPDHADDHQPHTSAGWGARVVIAAAVLAVAAIVILHLTGVVGPGAH